MGFCINEDHDFCNDHQVDGALEETMKFWISRDLPWWFFRKLG